MSNFIGQQDFLESMAYAIEPLVKKRIVDELYPRMDEILREEISKLTLRLVKQISFEGNKIIIEINDRRSR